MGKLNILCKFNMKIGHQYEKNLSENFEIFLTFRQKWRNFGQKWQKLGQNLAKI